MAKSSPLRRLVGQRLLMGLEGTEVSVTQQALFRMLQPGGVILFARNIESPEQTYALNASIARLSEIPLFHCVDMEGGTVDRFRDVLVPAPSAADVFATGDQYLFQKHGKVIGDEVRALGFNTNFAPTVDLDFPPSRSVLASRTVSSNPREATVYAKRFLTGMDIADVLGAGKHFPGLGEGNLDTHQELASINKSFEKLWEEDLFPFQALRKQFPFVMVAHAAYPLVTNNREPASLSSFWMKKILRKRIGYKGIIISDDLEMGGVLTTGLIEEVAVATIAAGADIFLVCHKEDAVLRCYEAVLREAERSKKFRAHVEKSAARILKLKDETKPVRKFPSAPTAAQIQKLKEQMQQFTQQVAVKRAKAENGHAETAEPLSTGMEPPAETESEP
jgi:beta-N-acetylhexosaminidase